MRVCVCVEWEMRVLPNGKWVWNGNANVREHRNMCVCVCVMSMSPCTQIMLLMREISTIITQIIGQNAHHLCSQIPITRHKLTFVFKTLQSMSMEWLVIQERVRPNGHYMSNVHRAHRAQHSLQTGSVRVTLVPQIWFLCSLFAPEKLSTDFILQPRAHWNRSQSAFQMRSRYFVVDVHIVWQ